MHKSKFSLCNLKYEFCVSSRKYFGNIKTTITWLKWLKLRNQLLTTRHYSGIQIAPRQFPFRVTAAIHNLLRTSTGWHTTGYLFVFCHDQESLSLSFGHNIHSVTDVCMCEFLSGQMVTNGLGLVWWPSSGSTTDYHTTVLECLDPGPHVLTTNTWDAEKFSERRKNLHAQVQHSHPDIMHCRIQENWKAL